MSETILVVDDEAEITHLLEIYLKNEGFEVRPFYRAKEALAYLDHHPVDLALLDVMLPDMDGFLLLTHIREKCADDYITKPFNPLEVVARVKTQLRRYTRYNPSTKTMPLENSYDIRGLVINRDTHKCTLYKENIELTPIEFEILWYLCQHQGKVVSSEELFEAVWQEKYYDNNNTVMAHIARLREKLHEPPRKPKFIKTVWGVGYQIEK